ncbi:hypothetical protein C2G38_2043512 [Gigaspora rosea]|uniref:ubiquitinyl hydrolase 1 n=1 Tax=Gigaspora rosea TaxID=44941 RepID=A0A397UJD5_9GLOM|nr:hypothetical protein C2G38_2043512 [Gigaspora rosea]
MITKHIAAHLNADPLKLRFTTAHTELAVIDIHISKTAKVDEFFKKIERKLVLKPTCRIRLYSVMDCIIQEEYDINDNIDKIQEKMTLYAEEIPQDEIKLGINDKVIQVLIMYQSRGEKELRSQKKNSFTSRLAFSNLIDKYFEVQLLKTS